MFFFSPVYKIVLTQHLNWKYCVSSLSFDERQFGMGRPLPHQQSIVGRCLTSKKKKKNAGEKTHLKKGGGGEWVKHELILKGGGAGNGLSTKACAKGGSP